MPFSRPAGCPPPPPGCSPPPPGFAAQVEREKIVERTARGKGERARKGQIPQGTGRGIYGYTYDPVTGTRSINGAQAPIVRRIFEEFAAHESCHAITERLNDEAVPAFAGGPWYSLTVRRMLTNPTYTGSSVYRRTRAVMVLDRATGNATATYRRSRSRHGSTFPTRPRRS